MGTRHMIGVVSGGKYRVAQYGQWDGYPSGQGVGILEFLIDGNLDALKRNVLKCSFISDDEYKELTKGYTNENAGQFFDKYPQFSRDTGSDILELVSKAEDGLKLVDNYEFAADSLFCEWAYIIDFDKNTFEIYEGFNNTPLEAHDRFFGMVCSEYTDKKNSSDIYYPVKLKKVYSLYDLPTVEEFLLELEPPDEGEELYG